MRAVADPQSLLEEKEALQEKLAINEYELRLAKEDIVKLQAELQKKKEQPSKESSGNLSICLCLLCFIFSPLVHDDITVL